VIASDLSVAGAAQEIFDQVGAKGIAIEYLVNNAGFGTHGNFAESDMSSQLAMVQVNIAALVELSRLFLPAMLGRKSGRIMQVASTAAYLPGPLMAVYYASKAFVLSFSEALDAEVAGSGVTVTALCPGPTSTEFQKRAGIANSPLFRGNTMTSAQVAQIGYAAMMGGKRTAICGLKNRFLALTSRLVPRRMSASVAYKLNQNR
jgi:short-subunit dehydrogenase